jgi:hypothetical protein
MVYRRFPESMAPRPGSTLWHARDLAVCAAVSLLAWMRGFVRVARLRLQARRLVRLRRRVQLELGGAAYAGDDAAVVTLVARLRGLDAELTACVAESTRAVAAARSGIVAERLAVARTEVRPAVR